MFLLNWAHGTPSPPLRHWRYTKCPFASRNTPAGRLPWSFRSSALESENQKRVVTPTPCLPKSVGLYCICNSDVPETHIPNQSKLFSSPELDWKRPDQLLVWVQQLETYRAKIAAASCKKCCSASISPYGWSEVQTVLAQEIAHWPHTDVLQCNWNKRNSNFTEKDYDLIWIRTKRSSFFSLFGMFWKKYFCFKATSSQAPEVRNIPKVAGSRSAA